MATDDFVYFDFAIGSQYDRVRPERWKVGDRLSYAGTLDLEILEVREHGYRYRDYTVGVGDYETATMEELHSDKVRLVMRVNERVPVYVPLRPRRVLDL